MIGAVTDELESLPGHLLRRAQQIAVAIFLDETAAHDVTPVQFAALTAIANGPGVDATRLAALIAVDRSTIGSVLDRLEAKGLIERRSSPDDRRLKLIHPLPAAGARLLDAVWPAVVRTQARIMAPLTERERLEFLRLLGRLVEANNRHSRAPQSAATV